MKRTRFQHAGVFGLGWGDEGKGKIVDLFCPAFDFVARINGGANAGHTVWVGGERFALHLLPTGILHPHVTAVIGQGVVVDPIELIREIDALSARDLEVSGRLKISDRAHLVMAYHKIEDQLSEQSAGLDGRIGTTARGIGPCYADKMRRTAAIRFTDLVSDVDLAPRVRRIVESRQVVFRALYGTDGGLDADRVLEDLATARRRLHGLVCDTSALLLHGAARGQSILFEGANGILLDVDHGTYPYVTSSSTGPYAVGSGSGVSWSRLEHVIGVTKSYATRVGAGPFVTELRDEIGERIRRQGNEFGTTTGRPRRCGWFDAVLCRYSVELCSPTDLALLHLDTLSGLSEVGLCTAYRAAGRTIHRPPADIRVLEQAEPIVEMLPGWSEDLRDVREFENLPPAAKEYVARVEAVVGAPVSIIGVGPDRSQTLIRGPLRELVGRREPAAAPVAT
jgi:adenylosuccinate synthase